MGPYQSEVTGILSTAIGPWPWAALTIFKATTLLGVAGLAATAMRRASAAARHWVWTLGVVALLALPLLSAALPRWTVPVPAGLGRFALPVAANPMVEQLVFSAAETSVGRPHGGAALAELPAAFEPAEVVAVAEAASTGGIPLVTVPDLSSRQWIFAIWLAGALFFLLRIAAGWVGTRRLERRAEVVTDSEWTGLLRDLAWMLDVDRSVRLLRSEAASIPLTWGTRRPTILIPCGADDWSAERRRVVLLHELAHVERRDCLTQTLASVACAAYWFHPLAWYAAGRLRAERERACDDRVLDLGTRASDYAGHLLEVARTFRPVGLAGVGAMAMARPSQLEGRLLAVLDPARSRWGLERRAQLFAAAAALIAIAPLAAMRTVEPRHPGPIGATDHSLKKLGAAMAAVSPVWPQLGLPPHPADAAAAQQRTVERRVPARPGGTLRLDLRTGAAVRVSGWDRDEVYLRGELGGRDWEETQVNVEPDAGNVRVETRQRTERRSTSTDHRLEIRVPNRYNVELASAGGSVRLEGLEGRFAGQTGGGSLTLRELRGDAQLRTGGGAIVATESRLDGELRTGGGEVRVDGVTGSLVARTGGGRVLLTDVDGVVGYTGGGKVIRRGRGSEDRGAMGGSDRWDRSGGTTVSSSGRVRVQRAGGAIMYGDAPGGASLQTGGGSIRLARAGGPVEAQTGGGAISLGPVAGPVRAQTGSGAITLAAVNGSLRAQTGSGGVEATMVGNPDSGDREVEILSGTGAVVLTLPEGIDATFDIETARTRGSSATARIISDFPLQISEEELSDDRYGGPRRRIRGTGRVGNGRHRIMVRTVNGEVRIRRGTARSSASSASGYSYAYRTDAATVIGDALGTALVQTLGNAFAVETAGCRSCTTSSTGARGSASHTGASSASSHDLSKSLRVARKQKDPGAVEALANALRTDANAGVRLNAAWALGQLESRAGVPALGDAVRGDAHPRVREMAAWALAQIEDPAGVPALRDALRRESREEVRYTAVWALGEVDHASAVPALADALGDSSTRIRERAAWTIGEIGPSTAPPALIAALRDPSASVRLRAVWALGEIEDATAARALAPLTRDSDASVRQTALWALAEMEDDEAAAALGQALRSTDPEIRRLAASALAGRSWARPMPWPMPRPRPSPPGNL